MLSPTPNIHQDWFIRSSRLSEFGFRRLLLVDYRAEILLTLDLDVYMIAPYGHVNNVKNVIYIRDIL